MEKMKYQPRASGFTLIELIVVMVIIALLAAIALPAYSSYIRKSKRSEAIATLLAMQMAEEKYRANNTTYGTLAQVWGGTTTSENGYYTLAISNVAATTYTLTATGNADQTKDAEGSTSCATLTLSVSGSVTTKTPSACWN